MVNVRKVMRRAAAPLTTRGEGRSCPVCGWTGGRFVTFGRDPNTRRDAQCPRCGSLERHRLAYVHLKDVLGPAETTLHVAPERATSPWLRRVSAEYTSIDLTGAKAMRAADITDLVDFDDGSLTLVYCSHVLEHVPDDVAAIREMHRVLAPGGKAVVLVPTKDGLTDEDPSLTDPAEQLARFGQVDHVRLYGDDIVDRLRAPGFEVERLSVDDVDPTLVEEHRLDREGTRLVFLCRKPA
jgi:SAM-dependent methyltransferase